MGATHTTSTLLTDSLSSKSLSANKEDGGFTLKNNMKRWISQFLSSDDSLNWLMNYNISTQSTMICADFWLETNKHITIEKPLCLSTWYWIASGISLTLQEWLSDLNVNFVPIDEFNKSLIRLVMSSKKMTDLYFKWDVLQTKKIHIISLIWKTSNLILIKLIDTKKGLTTIFTS